MQRRILLAEDNEDACSLFTLILEVEGYEVKACNDGETALAEFKQSPPDLLLTDLSLPKMDGFALIQAIKQDESFSHIPIILITAYGMGRLKHLRPLGVTCVLEKPIEPDKLTQAVQIALQPPT